jgi:hypothetical protein
VSPLSSVFGFWGVCVFFRGIGIVRSLIIGWQVWPFARIIGQFYGIAVDFDRNAAVIANRAEC